MSELPNITLLPDENVYFGAEFHPRLILRHLSHGVIVSDRRFVIRAPHTIFGVIPHGYVESSIPMDQVAELTIGKFTSTRRLWWGGLCTLFALLTLFYATMVAEVLVIPAFIILIVAIYFFITASQNGFHIQSTGSGTISAVAGLGEDSLVEDGKRVLNLLMYGAPRVPQSVLVQLR